ncbi:MULTISPECIES: ABC transporter ATP-binding protein [Halolamina]|uniref:ABC-type D-xylose/L-arabinose transporter n=1 Tax=Halolamina pelagica TaxID=699431 RepID=A0A1I5TG66_9EURY|nr:MULTISPECIES: ABC transporter ATP-binding protein [Halolamina]NHX37335.1 ABC transporter ATP-binding protein [Halolamina sp. R1-12]SFP82050.1 multiple sugar transport system ATP-binding protein [Halolamina pelagica]
MSDIQVDTLRKEFSSDGGPIVAVNDVSFTVEDGEFVCIVGPSGCGKTTLLRCIAGLERPTSGSITLAGEEVTDIPPQNRNLAFVFQDITLYPHMKVWENISYPLKLDGVDADTRYERAQEVADTIQIGELLDMYPGDLSGGQQQRVAIGRSIIRSPRAYLLDEPMSDLDAKLKKEMRVELQRIQQQVGGTMVYVTHDQEEAMTLSDRMIVMDDGEIQQFGSPQQVYHEPNNVFVAQFIGSPEINLLSATCRDDTGGTVTVDDTGWNIETGIASQGVPENVTFGFRPRHTNVEPVEDLDGLGGEVALVEAVGDENILYIDTEVGEIRAVVDIERTPIEEGDTVAVDVERSYLFDGATGTTVAHSTRRGDQPDDQVEA